MAAPAREALALRADPRVRPGLLPNAWASPRLARAALVVLTTAAALVRVVGLPNAQGTMGRDEARLALAARGILEHGLPLLPGGLMYTRGLLSSYLEAVAFAVFGTSDQVARLPSLVEGTLLVPAVYLLARGLGGPVMALAAAAIVAFSPALVVKSREAWLYSSFILWFVLALAWLQRAQQTGSLGDRIRAALAVAAALFSHEFGILLVLIAALHDLLRLGPWAGTHVPGAAADGKHWRRALGERKSQPGPWRELAAFWPIVLAALAIVAGLSLALRLPTAAGGTVEAREYLSPGLDVDRLLIGPRILAGWHPWLLVAAALGIPLRGIAHHRAALVYLALAAILAFHGLLLVNRGETRYMVVAVPLLAVAAVYGVWRSGILGSAAILGWKPAQRGRKAFCAILLLGLMLASISPAQLREDILARDVQSTWLQALPGRSHDDLIMSYAPTLTTHYLGRTDFWLRPQGYAKYVWAGQPPLRDIHSNAVVIRGSQEMDRFVVGPHPGRTLWVIVDADQAAGRPPAAGEVYAKLAAVASEQRRVPDGRVVLKVQL